MKYQEQDTICTPPIELPGSPLQIFFLPKNHKTKETHSPNRVAKAASLKIFKVRSKSGSVAPLKSLYFHWTAICSSSIVFTPRSLFLLFVLLFSGLIVEDLTTAATSPSKSHVNIDQILILNPYAANTFMQWKLLRVSLNRHYRLLYFHLYCLNVKRQFLCYFYSDYSDKDATIVSPPLFLI